MQPLWSVARAAAWEGRERSTAPSRALRQPHPAFPRPMPNALRCSKSTRGILLPELGSRGRLSPRCARWVLPTDAANSAPAPLQDLQLQAPKVPAWVGHRSRPQVVCELRSPPALRSPPVFLSPPAPSQLPPKGASSTRARASWLRPHGKASSRETSSKSAFKAKGVKTTRDYRYYLFVNLRIYSRPVFAT